MAERGVGTLVVVDDTSRPVGILTDRDLVLRILVERRDPDETTIGEVMSRPVHAVTEDTALESALRGMAGVGVRRAVVVDDAGSLVGILSLDDMLDLLAEEAEAIGGLVRRQGGGAPSIA
jgi:CBS domain-containing protein